MNHHIAKHTTQPIRNLMNHSKKTFVLTLISFLFGIFVRYLVNYTANNYNSNLIVLINIFTFFVIMYDNIVILPYIFGFYVHRFIAHNIGLNCVIYGLLITMLTIHFAFKVPKFVDDFILNQMKFTSILLLCCLNFSMFIFTPFAINKLFYICFSIIMHVNMLKSKKEVLYDLLYDENYIVDTPDDYAKMCSIVGILNVIVTMLIFS